MKRVVRTAAGILATLIATVTIAAAQTPPPAPPETKVDVSRGGLTISSGVNSLSIGARAQLRWTLDHREEGDTDTAGSGVGDPDGAISQFDVPRLRVTLSGGVYRPWLRYLFQFDFSRTSGEGASKLKDAFVEIRPVGRSYRLTAGQFKVPFGLQQMTSSARLQFVDRAITDAKFNPGRDMGVTLNGTVPAHKIGYDLGLFNGSGESLRQNNRSHLWVARVYFDPLGPYGLAEGASDAGAKPVLHVGFAARGGKQIRGRTLAGVVDDADDQTAWGVEFAYKAPRFYSTAEYMQMIDEQTNPTPLADIDSRGFHAQAGFMAVPKRVEIGFLVASVTANSDVDDAGVTEWRAGVGYYWQAHNLKLQADAGQLGYGARFASLSARARQGMPVLGTRLVAGRDLSDTQVRVQLTLAF